MNNIISKVEIPKKELKLLKFYKTKFENSLRIQTSIIAHALTDNTIMVKLMQLVPVLYDNNKSKFQKLFGKADFCYDTWYRSWNWIVEFKNTKFVVSSSIRGSVYYLLIGEEATDEECFNFLCEIAKMLEKYE